MGTLIGREDELARLDEVLRAGGALMVRGPRGCGVSALLDGAVEKAGARGLGVLRAVGVEAESGFPYAGLHALLRPLRRAVEALPAEPGEALRASFGFSEGVVPADEVAAALVALARDAEPGVVCVDDWQWVDAESRAAISAFIGAGVGVPVLLGGHGDGVAGVDELVVGPLDPVSAAALLDDTLPLLVRERVLREAAGRPLALMELPAAYAAVGDGVLLGSWAPLTPALEEAFGAEDLPSACAHALLLAALDDAERLHDVLAAAGAATADVLAPAVAAGLVEVDGDRLRFAHPLTRSAVRHAASPAARAAGHAALAAGIAARDPDRAVWHRVVGAPGTDEGLASELEAVALRSRDRGDYERAAAGLRRAANLTPAGPERSRRLLLAAELAAEIGGVDVATRLLEDVVPAHVDDTGRVRALVLRPRVSPGTLAATARTCVDPELALRLWWRATTETQASAGDGAALAHEALVSAPTLTVAADGRPTDRSVSLAYRGKSTTRGAEQPVALALRGYLALVTGDLRGAAALLERAVHELRAQRRRTRLGQVLALAAHARLGVSDLDRAWEDGLESAALCRQVRQPLWGALARTALARIAALRGDEDAAEEHAGEAERIALRVKGASVLAAVQQARGALALGAGRPGEAFAHLRRPFDPTDPAYDLGTALTALDDLAESATTDEERAFVRDQLAAAGDRAALAQAHATLVLAEDGDADAAFERAAAVIGEDVPLAHARMLLVHGMRVRRNRRPADSRTPLRAAAATFERLGAKPWAEKAQRELAATAETAHRSEATVDRLTPRELEIARLVARGLTNPAIAADLALSPRTVGHHLGKIFPKLDVSSRANVGAALERLGY
ncbi:AAA family ATPase [Solirubrobacter sp. CPCC 204708]|uniref:AAA family ATPase n=1 Tax=Solirubrobacter deserti TaxID=2282478 RepID=A0ABT4RQI8_9ACTN|nr:LuxR family transcriptional regulator [Solirubrobacter deserti]MBE2320548.1 AAA family ATPase [Solirubrobacter deserti]MDA0140824.1 AAA family ATPase [Solirubrobacter deserti]